jgi:cell division septum initiation protein DivIVA
MTAERASLRGRATTFVDTSSRGRIVADVSAGATLPLMSEVATAPSFRVALRGYDTREVDRYAHLVEAELQATKVAHRELAADVRSLADQLDRATEELAILRRRPSVDDTIAFRHLGPRVEQILADAHAEADEIRAAASRAAEEVRSAAEEQVRAIQEEHVRVATDFAAHRRWLHDEDDRWVRLLRSRQEQVTRAEHYRRKIQEGAEEILDAATREHERVLASALARAEEMLDQATAQADQIRDDARRRALGSRE